MSRGAGRRKPCDVTDARARLAKAEQFLTVAELAQTDPGVRSAETSLLVDAGIAAADAICCVRLGQRSADGNHAAAVELVASVDIEAAKRLRTLLSIKSLAQYDTDDPSAQKLTAVRRAAQALVASARAAVTGIR
jgi:hypothetical protein